MNALLAAGISTAVIVLAAFGSAGVPAGRIASRQDAAAPSSRTQDLIGYLQERARLVPWDATAHLKLGQAYLGRARETADPTYYTKAEGVLQRALELQPGEPAALAALGNLALSRHQFHEALAWGQAAREANAGLAAAYGVIGDALVELDRYPEAFEAFQKMVDRRPDLSSYARVSYARELTGDIPGAVEAMRGAAEAGGTVGEPAAWARTQLGDLLRFYEYGGAERQFEMALQALPGYGPALAGMARVTSTNGAFGDAVDLARRAFEALPSLEHGILLCDLLHAAGREAEAQAQDTLVSAIRRLNEAAGFGPEPEPRTARLPNLAGVR